MYMPAVGGLADRVGEEAGRDRAVKVLLLDFGLNGRVTFQAGNGHQVEVVQVQFGQGRNLGLHEEGRLGWVQAHRQVVEGHFGQGAADLFGVAGVIG